MDIKINYKISKPEKGKSFLRILHLHFKSNQIALLYRIGL